MQELLKIEGNTDTTKGVTKSVYSHKYTQLTKGRSPIAPHVRDLQEPFTGLSRKQYQN